MRGWIGFATCVACALLIGRALMALPVQNPPPPPVVESLEVGSIAAEGAVHRIDRPGIYGLAQPPVGSSYAVVGNNLVRLDSETDQIKAVVRRAVTPVDEATLP